MSVLLCTNVRPSLHQCPSFSAPTSVLLCTNVLYTIFLTGFSLLGRQDWHKENMRKLGIAVSEEEEEEAGEVDGDGDGAG
jgi:hypothetical protein